MTFMLPTQYPEYFTSTIHHWEKLLATNKAKDIILESLRFLKENNKVVVYAFVIMHNHVHIIWQPCFDIDLPQVQASFRKHTSKQLLQTLSESEREIYKVNKYDRTHQIWKREPLSIVLYIPAVFAQKLNYIHQNPVKAGICSMPEDYYYSSANFYNGGERHADILSHYLG